MLEANPAAGSLLGAPVEALSGRTLRQHIDQALQPTLEELLVTRRLQADPLHLRRDHPRRAHRTGRAGQAAFE